MTKVTIGTVSEGTLRTEDLLEEFAGELHRLDKDNTLLATVEKLWAASHDMEYRERDGWEYCLNCGNCEDELDQLCSEASARISEHADYLVQELTDALNSYCPPFVYFGTHPGDGADFGFWPDMDALHEAMYDTRHIVGVENPPSDVGEHTFDDCIVQVSDHGNIMVMDMERNELWSVV